MWENNRGLTVIYRSESIFLVKWRHKRSSAEFCQRFGENIFPSKPEARTEETGQQPQSGGGKKNRWKFWSLDNESCRNAEWIYTRAWSPDTKEETGDREEIGWQRQEDQNWHNTDTGTGRKSLRWVEENAIVSHVSVNLFWLCRAGFETCAVSLCLCATDRMAGRG